MLTTIIGRIISLGFVGLAAIACDASAHASEAHRPIDALATSDQVRRTKRETRTVVVVKPLTTEPLLQIENLRLEAAPPKAPQPSAILKFDLVNDTWVQVTDLVMSISFVETRLPDTSTTPPRVLVGPVTIRVGEILNAGYALQYEMLFRNLSSDCECSPNVAILSARLLPD